MRPGDTVLTLGSGGVSIFALQLALAPGATVIATTSSPDKERMLRELGAHDVINYRSAPDWGQAARAMTGGGGVDRIVELGGPGTIAHSLDAVARGGEIVLVGFLTEENPGIDYFRLKGSGATIRSIGVGDRANLESLSRALSATEIRPTVDRVFAFDDAPGAFRRLQSGAHVGKIVIRMAHGSAAV